MSETQDIEWLAEEQILTATGISPFMFGRYRAAGYFTKDRRPFYGRGGGSDPYHYAQDTINIIEWLRDHRKETRSDNERFWGLWFAGLLDIARWTDNRLARMLKKSAALQHEIPESLEKGVAEFARTPAKRTDPHRMVFRHLQEQKGRKLLFEWAAAIGIGAEPAINLYDPGSQVEAAFKKGIGANCVPDRALDVEKMSLQRLHEIVKNATPAQMLQVRLDCMTLDSLVKTAQAITNWRLSSPRNAQDGSVSRIAPFERLSALWRSFDARAAIIPFLIYVRTLPEYARDLDDRFAEFGLELEALAAASLSNRESIP